MVTTKILSPEDNSLSLMAHLHGSLRIFRQINDRGLVEFLRLEDGNDTVVVLGVEWADVVFKFEIFSMTIQPLSSGRAWEWELLTNFGAEQTISCVFRFEWQRPALPGEVRIDWEQIFSGNGRRSSVPETAVAVGLSMVGVLFNEKERSNGQPFLVMVDADEPGTFRIVRDDREIQRVIATSECVALVQAQSFKGELENWMRARFRG